MPTPNPFSTLGPWESNLHTYLYNVVIEQQPEAMTFHNGDVMSTVRTTGKERRSESHQVNKSFFITLQLSMQKSNVTKYSQPTGNWRLRQEVKSRLGTTEIGCFQVKRMRASFCLSAQFWQSTWVHGEGVAVQRPNGESMHSDSVNTGNYCTPATCQKNSEQDKVPPPSLGTWCHRLSVNPKVYELFI